ncbi:MAG: flippase-like domain-containing protein [Arenicellales bacterium]
MKIATSLALLAGLALLGWLLSQTDLAAAARLVTHIGWGGAAAVIVVFAAGFAVEVGAFALIFVRRTLSAAWFRDLWLVNMLGEALNVVMPFGALGGEPFKAVLLKRHYRVPFVESASALVLMQTLLSLMEALFALIGVILAVRAHLLPTGIETAMTSAAVVFSLLLALALLAIHMRWLASLLRWLETSRWGGRLTRVIAGLNDLEHRMFTFVRRHPARFGASLFLFFLNWLAGAVEVWLILHLLGSPLPFLQCWVIEAAVALTGSATVFIPANLGSFEAVTVFVTAAFTGSPEIGLALALVRRARQLFWSGLGLAAGGWYNLRQPAEAPASPD